MQTLGANVAEAAVSRSFLFVPADSERKLAKAESCGADAIIIDLEDSVAVSALPKARGLAAEFLSAKHDADTWVRINSLDSCSAEEDLEAVVPAGPVGIVLPKPRDASDSAELAKLLDGTLDSNYRYRPISLTVILT